MLSTKITTKKGTKGSDTARESQERFLREDELI